MNSNPHNDIKISTQNSVHEENSDSAQEQNQCKVLNKKKIESIQPCEKIFNFYYTISCLIIAVICLLIITMIIIAYKFEGAKFDNGKLIEDCKYEGTSLKVLVNGTSSLSVMSISKLILSDGINLWSYNPQCSSTKILREMENPIGAFDVDLNETIFWIEKDTSKIHSSTKRALNATHNHYFTDIILNEPKFTPEAIALDHFTKKLYAIDKLIGVLIVIDIQTKQYGIISTYLNEPQDIVLDPAQGFLFIQQLDSILGGNMDGSDIKRIITEERITGITIDQKLKNIYWINDWVTVERIDYNGSNRQVIFKSRVEIISLTTFNNKLFWLRPTHDESNTLWSCDIHINKCENHMIQRITPRNATHVKVFEDQNILIDHACNYENGKCQHLCLLTPPNKKNRSCACYLGWQLKSNLKSCEPNQNLILYIQGNFIRGQTLSMIKPDSKDVILPTQLYTESLSQKIIDFDYDQLNDDLYFNDYMNIYKTKLKSFQDQTLIYNCANKLDNLCKIKYIVFDWLSKNLLYLIDLPFGYQKIIMFDVKKSKNLKTLLQHTNTNEALDFHPRYGYVSIMHSYSSHRILVNDSKYVDFFNNNYQAKPHLAIDYKNDQICVLVEKTLYTYSFTNRSKIKIVGDYDISNENRIDLPFNFNKSEINSFRIYHNWAYVSTQDGIWRTNRTGDNNIKQITQEIDYNTIPSIFRMKIFSSDVQFAIKDNPCDVDNGGCEQFCFPLPEKTCDCVDDQKVQKNGRCV